MNVHERLSLRTRMTHSDSDVQHNYPCNDKNTVYHLRRYEEVALMSRFRLESCGIMIMMVIANVSKYGTSQASHLTSFGRSFWPASKHVIVGSPRENERLCVLVNDNDISFHGFVLR